MEGLIFGILRYTMSYGSKNSNKMVGKFKNQSLVTL